MKQILDYPVIAAVLIFAFLWVSTRLTSLCVRNRALGNNQLKHDFGIIVTAVLTLMGLVIGFTLSAAISRFDLRKNYEAAEANAIGAEYMRADLLPVADGVKLRQLLKLYTAQRILYYGSHGKTEFQQIAASRSHLQDDLWAAVLPVAAAHSTPITALAVSGMNDVLNSQGYTHAAWLSRIPLEAWVLLLLLALLSNLLITYGRESLFSAPWLLAIVPLVVSVSFLMIADIDSPRSGLVQVTAPNLTRLLNSMH